MREALQILGPEGGVSANLPVAAREVVRSYQRASKAASMLIFTES